MLGSLIGLYQVTALLEVHQLKGLDVAHEMHRRLGGIPQPNTGCIPVSVLIEHSPARGTPDPATVDRLYRALNRLNAVQSALSDAQSAVVQAQDAVRCVAASTVVGR